MTGPVRLIGASVLALALSVAIPASAANDAPERPYEDHVVARFEVQSVRQTQALLALNLVSWSCNVSMAAPDFMLSPEQRLLVDQLGLTYEILVPDVQRLVDAEREAIEAARAAEGGIAGSGDDWFTVYRTTAEVNAYIDELVALRPDLASKLTIGSSIEGRTIYGMRITAPGGDGKPAVLFNGMQHAREWIAVMVPMYIADRLVRFYDQDPRIKAVLDNVVVYVVPLVNPDGYEFSQLPGNRMWRKNRRDNPGSQCFGVDLNRNWDLDWGGPHTTSTHPCSDNFIGSGPDSEPEVEYLAAFIEQRPYIAAHIDFHSYTQLVIHPWAHTTVPHPEVEQFMALATIMANAIVDVHGTTYLPGSSGQLLYLVSGAMPDWTTAAGIRGYLIEVRPATFHIGFLLPPQQILPTAEENFIAALLMAESVAQGVVLHLPHGVPAHIDSGGSTTVKVRAASISSGPLDPSAATLYTRVGGRSEYIGWPMVHLGDDLYEAAFPQCPCGEEIEFYFEVASLAGNDYRVPIDAPSSVYSAACAPVIFADDFDERVGWRMGAPDDDATTGHWEWGTPIGTQSKGYQVQPSASFIGANCWFTGQHTPGKAPSFNDVSNGKTTLFSPVFDLSGVEDGIISYRRWYTNHAGVSPHNDVFVVDISPDGGETWVNMEVVGPGGAETVGGWQRAEFHISQYIPLTDQVQVRFIASDYDPQALVEAAVDMFRIVATDCGPEPQCPADLNGDGSVGVPDLLIMLAAWGECPPSGPCPADLTGDGNVGEADLLELLAQWGDC